MATLAACASTFLAGFLYFITAVPAGRALGLPLWLAALAAWLGYSAGGAVVAYGGAPLREWLTRRFPLPSAAAEKPSLITRAWRRFGPPGLGLLAPVTCGPQLGALIGLALGGSRHQLVFWIAVGAIPWTAVFAVTLAFGLRWFS